MAEKNQQSVLMKRAARDFLKAVQDKASDEKLKDILTKNPKLLESKEFAKQVFPKVKNKENMGLVPLDKMMDTVKRVKDLTDKGIVSAEQFEAFSKTQNPMTGENFATFAAKQAVAAYDKANLDRSPEQNLSDDGKNTFQQKSEEYAKNMEELKNLGISMDSPDRNGQTVEDISKVGQVKDEEGYSPVLSSKILTNNKAAEQQTENTAAPLNIEMAENSEGLEIGGEEKPALKVETQEKPAVKVNVQPQKKEENEDENEATVEDAPEEDKSKGSSWEGSKIGEQDIIQYMYNEWFLASLNWSVNKVVGGVCGAVDRTCDKFEKKHNAPKNKSDKANSQKAKDFQKDGLDFMDKMPENMREKFAQGLDDRNGYISKLGQDVRANVGKTPQKWTVLDENNPKDKAMIENINQTYKKDPKGFMEQLNAMENSKQMKNAMVRVYDVAVQAATTEYMAKHMKKNGELPDWNDENVQKDIAKATQKKYSSLMAGVTGVAEHIKLDMELNEGVKDPAKIANAQQVGVEELLKTAEHAVGKSKGYLTDDLKKSNYKSAGGEISKDTKESLDKTDKFFEACDKHKELLLPKKRKEAGLDGLDEAATKFNTRSVIQNSAAANIANDIKAMDSQIEGNKQRKEKFKNNKTYEEILSKNNKFKNYSTEGKNDALYNAVYAHKRNNGR